MAKEVGFEVHLRYIRCPERCETVDGLQSDFSVMVTVQENRNKVETFDREISR